MVLGALMDRYCMLRCSSHMIWIRGLRQSVHMLLTLQSQKDTEETSAQYALGQMIDADLECVHVLP